MIYHAFPRHQYIALFLLLLLSIGMAVFWINKGRAHHFPDAPNGQFGCLSYTPRSDGIHLTEADTRKQIAIDMQQLSARTHCVRTYSVMGGLDEVPAVARKLGMHVLLGIWIGRNDEVNELELKHGIDVANENRDVIDAVIVGNEVLLRREQSAPILATMMQRVHNETQLPVTYADVWDFWLKNPSLADSASFITIHILPYWDDIPIAIDHAMNHVDDIYKKIQNAFPGKAIYVGETGWPSAGRQREGALPSLINEARFTREFIAFANAHSLPNNFIEAYDQPWKKALEGTVGGYWGLYDADGHEKFPLTGPVIEDVKWWRGLLGGGVVAALLTLFVWIKQVRTVPLLATYALAGFCLGAVIPIQWHYWMISNRDWQEWLCAVTWGATSDAVFICALIPVSTEGIVIKRLVFAAESILLFGVAYINLGLVFDARYRDFPSMFLLLPTITLLIAKINFSARDNLLISLSSIYKLMFACWMLISIIAIVYIEHFSNFNAIWWCICCALLAWAVLPYRSRMVQPLQTKSDV